MARMSSAQQHEASAWPSRIHSLFASIAWCAALNAMWLAFTLLGGVVFGAGPATVTACIVARRRMRGETIHLRDFAATWRKEFARGTIAVLPVFAVLAVLYSNYVYFSS